MDSEVIIRSETNLRRPPVHAFVHGGEARVKRIERPKRPSASANILLSDNPEVPSELRCGAEVEQMQMAIIGKVVWLGHAVRP